MADSVRSSPRSLSIILPNYNGQKLIPRFFPSVLEAAGNYSGDWEIIFVDDRSTDRSVRIIQNHMNAEARIRLITARVNSGFSRTCNLGIRAAKGEILFLLNTDVELAEDYFDHFNQHFEDPEVFAVTCCGYRYGTDEQIDGIKRAHWRKGFLRVTDNIFDHHIMHADIEPPYRSFGMQGAYFFARADRTNELGGFDELFSPFFLEETDLGYRALKRGWKIIYEPRCRGWHQVSASVASKAKQRQRDILSARNRLFFTWKNIHSPRLFRSHLSFLVLRLLLIDTVEWRALLQALKNRKEVSQLRQIEKEQAVLSDEELLDFYGQYFRGFSA